jgi:hypothetical protein
MRFTARPRDCVPHGLVQVRYYDGSEKLKQKESDYAKDVIYMTSFTTDEFSAILAETGFTLSAQQEGSK